MLAKCFYDSFTWRPMEQHTPWWLHLELIVNLRVHQRKDHQLAQKPNMVGQTANLGKRLKVSCTRQTRVNFLVVSCGSHLSDSNDTSNYNYYYHLSLAVFTYKFCRTKWTKICCQIKTKHKIVLFIIFFIHIFTNSRVATWIL